MERLIIHIQSMNDIVTNSSSEIIIMKGSDKDKEDLIEMLENIWKAAKLDENSYWGYTAYIADRTYRDKDWGYTVTKGDVVIESTKENSIPYWITEFLSSTNLDCSRFHLG